jgi:cytidine deaminase
MDPSLQSKLVAQALAVRANAFAKYSRYRVGAAVQSSTGKTYVGCNVENISYGVTICAERAAVCAAVAAEGQQVKIVAFAVATKNGGSPCGACRQFLAEFNLKSQPMEIAMVAASKPPRVRVMTLDELLPEQFSDPALKAGKPKTRRKTTRKKA